MKIAARVCNYAGPSHFRSREVHVDGMPGVPDCVYCPTGPTMRAVDELKRSKANDAEARHRRGILAAIGVVALVSSGLALFAAAHYAGVSGISREVGKI